MTFTKVVAAPVFAFLLVATTAGGVNAGCGDFNADGKVTSTDALGTLQVAVGSLACDLVRCDVDDSGSVTASDALKVLGSAVGQPLVLGCPAVALGSIDDLPLATGPVANGSAAASLVAGIGAVTAGIGLDDVTTSFGANSSRAACEITNMVRDAIESAAQADRIICYVQNVFATNPSVGVDLYDGQPHVFGLDFGEPPPGATGEDAGGPSSVSLRIVRNEQGAITDFEMFACREGPAGLFQNEYVHQTIDGPDFSMVAKGIHSGGGGSGRHHVEVRAGFNDAGQFAGTKVVELAHEYTETQYAGFGELTFGQGSATFSVDGYDVGAYSDPIYGSGTWGREVHSEGEFLDFNDPADPYSLSLLAVGDGAAKAHFSGSDDYGSWSDDHLEGWNGDTTLVDPLAASDFLDLVGTADLVEPGIGVTIDFEGGEVFDCSTPIEAVVQVDMALLDVECRDLELGHEWVNCHEIVDDGAN